MRRWYPSSLFRVTQVVISLSLYVFVCWETAIEMTCAQNLIDLISFESWFSPLLDYHLTFDFRWVGTYVVNNNKRNTFALFHLFVWTNHWLSGFVWDTNLVNKANRKQIQPTSRMHFEFLSYISAQKLLIFFVQFWTFSIQAIVIFSKTLQTKFREEKNSSNCQRNPVVC